MIGRIRRRRSFERLQQDGVRIRCSTLWCTWCPDPDASFPRVAFALGRALGPAVVRNRLRRRLRAALAELDRTGAIPPVTMLIGGRPAATELTYVELQAELAVLMAKISPPQRS